VFAGESGYFVAVAADGHRTPAAAVRARIVVKEKTTMWIRTKPKARLCSFGDKLGARSGYGGEQPVKASFACNEFDFPEVVPTNQLIVPFGDAQDFVDRRDPFPGHPLLSEHGREHLAQGNAEAPGLHEKSFRSLRVDLRQQEKLGAAFS
jgi:hypothetical protein